MRILSRTLGLGSTALLLAPAALASSHREAPITGLDHKADITDLYAFVSYDANQVAGQTPEKVTMVMCVDPLLEPGNGPTYFPFDPSILYEIHIDNDHDALADRTFRFRFESEYQLPGVPVGLAGFGPNGAFDPVTGALVVPPRIDDFQDVGLNLRQTYTVEFVEPETGRDAFLQSPEPFYAVPTNAGERTMDYASLYHQGTYSLPTGTRVFAGTVDDPFWIDLGAAFDTLNLRTLGSGVPGVLTATEDAAQSNFASDTVSGYNVNAIAIEVPIQWLTSTRQLEPASSPNAVVGAWATTSRQRTRVLNSPDAPTESGPWRQIQRLANPLINELIIGIGSKDRFSMDAPVNDQQFAGAFLDPVIAQVAEALYGGALDVPEAPRTDLLPLVQYGAPVTTPGPIADLLRLNTGIPATPPAEINRKGILFGDAAGWPNGRRLQDDVVDVALRAVLGGILDPTHPGFTPGVSDVLGDGVNVNDLPFVDTFPYLAGAHSGRTRRHIDPGEPGGGPVQ